MISSRTGLDFRAMDCDAGSGIHLWLVANARSRTTPETLFSTGKSDDFVPDAAGGLDNNGAQKLQPALCQPKKLDSRHLTPSAHESDAVDTAFSGPAVY